jgi:hypothetical protein
MAQSQLTIAQIAEAIEQLPVEEQQQLVERFRFSASRKTGLEGLVNLSQKKESSETDRYGGIDLSEYEGQIEPEQLELLKEFMGAFEAPEDFDPTRIYHPLDY